MLRDDMHKMVMFSETDTETEDFMKDSKKAILENEKLIDASSSDSNKFLI